MRRISPNPEPTFSTFSAAWNQLRLEKFDTSSHSFCSGTRNSRSRWMLCIVIPIWISDCCQLCLLSILTLIALLVILAADEVKATQAFATVVLVAAVLVVGFLIHEAFLSINAPLSLAL